MLLQPFQACVEKPRDAHDVVAVPYSDVAETSRDETKITEEQLTAISRAVADPRRLAILRQIAAAQQLTCSELDAHECLSPATISHHLKELQAAHLIAVERTGRVLQVWLRRDVWEAYLRELASL